MPTPLRDGADAGGAVPATQPWGYGIRSWHRTMVSDHGIEPSMCRLYPFRGHVFPSMI